MPHDPNLRFVLCTTGAGVNPASFQVLAGDLELMTEADYTARETASPTFPMHHPVVAQGVVDDLVAWIRGQAAAGTETPDQREEWLRRHASSLGGAEYPPPPPPPPPPRVRPTPDPLPPRQQPPPPGRIAETPLNMGWAYRLLPAVGGIVLGGTFLLLSLLAAVTPVANNHTEGGGGWAIVGAFLSLAIMAGGVAWTVVWFRRNRRQRP